MTYGELDLFVTDAAMDIKHKLKVEFGKELSTTDEQSITDYLWFVLGFLINEDSEAA